MQTESTGDKMKKEWFPAKINGKWSMARIEEKAINARRMKWWERIKYWYLKKVVERQVNK